MATINSNFKNVSPSYLFSEVVRRTKSFSDSHPGVELLRLGIGNTTLSIVPSVVDGLRSGVEKLAKAETYTGYGDEQGDARLRYAIAAWYGSRGITIEPGAIFVSDGAKPDCANIQSIFSDDSVVAISDPVYPVYLDSNAIAGKKILYMPATEGNGFVPEPPRESRQGRDEHADLIFLCSPNNPTGAVATREQLQAFVDWARAHKAVIIFDAAYSEYIRNTELPRSIYEIEGAKSCAIEIQSFSKAAGFTGVRLGWTVVPKELIAEDAAEGILNQMWNRRQTTMFNGASNIAQEGGLAVLSQLGQRQTHEQVDYYMENARIIREGLAAAGFKVSGGVHAPYIWLANPRGLSSWDFFDELLEKAHVVATPGSGFGKNGEGYMRLSAFGARENIEKAVRSICKNVRVS